jgi:adenine phosphoribosyltransferase
MYEKIKSKIRTIPHWPKHGVMFRDITTLLQDAPTFNHTIELLKERYKNLEIDLIVGIESRGFIIGSALAHALKKGFVPIRKKGRLPHHTESQEYRLEYGMDTIEIHKDAIKSGNKVLLVDDLLATGGTALAACQLIEKLEGHIVECCFVIDLPDLLGREKLEESGYVVFSLVEFKGE